jgi:ribonuclease D
MLVTAQSELSQAIDHLRTAASFAYDTEFIGELTYHPTLCLIQVATTRQVMLIDPLARGLDLHEFWELLADPSVEKIVHAGEQDVEPVPRQLGDRSRGAQNVIDTQVAAGFVGMAYPVALSKLIGELFAVRIGKGLTFTHWDQRPLSDVQLRYAADDVRYLPAAWDVLRQRLDALGHRAWAFEECAAMCDPLRFGFNPDSSYQRVRGAGGLGTGALAILRELTIWRDAAARAHDVPARALLRDEILIDLARSPVKHVEKLARVRGLPRPVEFEHGRAIVEATLRAINNPHPTVRASRGVEPTPSERFAADSLYAIASSLCAARSIDPALVTSRQEIGELYHRLISGSAHDNLHLFTGWRRDALGRPLIDFLAGRAGCELAWRDGKLVRA